jgi:sensor histidine kinase YesM
MKKSTEISIHVFFWVIYIVFTYMLCKIYLQAQPTAPFGQHLFYVVFLELMMGLIFFYITFFSIPFIKKRKINILFIAITLLVLLIFFAYPAFREGFWQIMSSIIPHIILIFLAIVFYKFFDSIKLEKEKQALILKNTQSELALLKMHISPHFLFNTLNNIDYLITSDASRASNTIAKLGEILRYTIYDAEVEKIPLSKEIDHLNNYIELIRLRTLGPDFITFNIKGQVTHLQIAPMIFLPLIENAYKHSSNKEDEKVIDIQIKIEDKSISFEIKNKFDSTKSTKPIANSGIGLKIVKRRLDLIYHEKHSFEISHENNYFIVKLNIKLDEY